VAEAVLVLVLVSVLLRAPSALAWQQQPAQQHGLQQ